MKHSVAAFLVILASLPAAAAGIDGKWEAVIPDGPSGVLLELKSDGGRLNGWLSQPNGKLEITKGSIQGNAVSFEMAVKIRGEALTLSYSGELAGDKLNLTLGIRGRPGGEAVTLKRVDPNVSPSTGSP